VAFVVHAAVAAAGATSISGDGLVVESVTSGGAADVAGLRPGDALKRWTRAAQAPANPEAASGELRWPADLEDVEVEQAPRGPVSVEAERDGKTLTVALPTGEWLLDVRPQLPPELLTRHEHARRQARRERFRRGGVDLARPPGVVAQFAEVYADHVQVLVEQGRAVEAIRVLEAARGHALLLELSERELLDTVEVHRELADARRAAEADYATIRGALARLPAMRRRPRSRRSRGA
jgi:hypothetical protein